MPQQSSPFYLYHTMTPLDGNRVQDVIVLTTHHSYFLIKVTNPHLFGVIKTHTDAFTIYPGVNIFTWCGDTGYICTWPRIIIMCRCHPLLIYVHIWIWGVWFKRVGLRTARRGVRPTACKIGQLTCSMGLVWMGIAPVHLRPLSQGRAPFALKDPHI